MKRFVIALLLAVLLPAFAVVAVNPPPASCTVRANGPIWPPDPVDLPPLDCIDSASCRDCLVGFFGVCLIYGSEYCCDI